jgi:hypothetical protein
MPNYRKIPKRMISENAQIQYVSKNSLGAGKPFAKCVTISDHGFRANVHMFFDNMKFHDELGILINNIEKREQALSTMTTKPSELHAYDRCFIFHENKQVSYKHEH